MLTAPCLRSLLVTLALTGCLTEPHDDVSNRDNVPSDDGSHDQPGSDSDVTSDSDLLDTDQETDPPRDSDTGDSLGGDTATTGDTDWVADTDSGIDTDLVMDSDATADSARDSACSAGDTMCEAGTFDSGMPFPGELQITEVMSLGSGCGADEGLYVEVENVSASRSFSLDGATMEAVFGAGQPPFASSTLSGARRLAPGDVAVIAPHPNCWGLVPDYVVSGLATTLPMRSVEIFVGRTGIVQATTDGSSLTFPWSEQGVAIELDDGAAPPTWIPGGGGFPRADPGDWCRADVAIAGHAGDLGSPGAPNGACPP